MMPFIPVAAPDRKFDKAYQYKELGEAMRFVGEHDEAHVASIWNHVAASRKAREARHYYETSVYLQEIENDRVH